MSMDKAVVFDIKRYAIHDGPGIRTTVFFKGCPLHCSWCHNPEGIKPEFELVYKPDRCIAGCRVCVEVCPQKAIRPDRTGIFVDRHKCQVCGKCAEACPSNALERVGEEVSVDELMVRIEKDRVFFEESGGGVTFSGGEPLYQSSFLIDVLTECRRRNVHVCLDTCGYAPPDIMERVIAQTDLFLFDLKIMDDTKHRKHTGFSNRLILKNLRLLEESCIPYIIRIPLIPGINDSLEDIQQTGEFIRSLERVVRIELLPYHDIASHKYTRLDRPAKTGAIKPAGENWLRDIQNEFEKFDLNISGGDSS